MGDADRLLELSRQAQGLLDEDSSERRGIVEASELLGRLLLQDVERTDDVVSLKRGVSRDRMVSVHDPDMRHGHKSSSRRFDGHKASVAVDTDSQLITAVDVLAGNASDNVGALAMVERSEDVTGSVVEETIGDAVYGDGVTRQVFADAGRPLVARLPRRPERKYFPKEDFEIDLESGTCTCPAGHTTGRVYRMGTRTDSTGRTHQLRAFRFDAAVCGGCALRHRCVAAGEGEGTNGESAPSGGAASAGARVAQERWLYEVWPAARGGGTQTGPPGPARNETGSILRTSQDAVPTADGGDCGKPDAGGGQGGCDGRRWVGKPLSVLSPVSRRHIKDLVE